MTKMQKAAKKAWVTIRKNKQVRHDAAVKAWVTRRNNEQTTLKKEILIKMAKAGLPKPGLDLPIEALKKVVENMSHSQDNKVLYKKALLEMAKKGMPRPTCTK